MFENIESSLSCLFLHFAFMACFGLFLCVNLTWNEDIEENQRLLEISLGKIINQMNSGGPLVARQQKSAILKICRLSQERNRPLISV